jgi:hypothetical protein
MGMLKGIQVGGYLKSRQHIALVFDDLKGKNSGMCSGLIITGTPGSLKPDGDAAGCELAQGVLKVSFSRLLGQHFLSTDGSTNGGPVGQWGGASDMGARIEAYNYAKSGSARGGIQTLRVYTYNAPGGSLANIVGTELSVYDRGEYTDGYSSDNVTTLLVSQRCRSVVKTRTNILVVDDRSDGSHSLTTCLATALVRIHGEGGASFGVRKTCIHMETAGDSTGWTHAFSFQTAAGKEGYTAIADGALKGNVNGYIKIYDVATGQTLYLNAYDTVPS